MNRFVLIYYKRREEGYSPVNAFAGVASLIAGLGTYEDLVEVDRVYLQDTLNEIDKTLEEINEIRSVSNEPITRAVSAK